MTKTAVQRVWAFEALDSRGRPTVGCRVSLAGGGEGRAIVPSGKSTGSHEARELRDGGDTYGGRGTRKAVAAVNGPLAGAVVGLDAEDQVGLDKAMEALDADTLLSHLGSNAVLAVSVAAVLAVADQVRQPLWRVLAGEGPPLLPRPMVNIISGGAHAEAGGGYSERTVDVQDVLVVPLGAGSFAEALERAWRVREATAELLSRAGVPSGLVADEGGAAGWLVSNEAAVATVARAIEAAGLRPGEDAGLAVDLAADQFYHSRPDGTGTYDLALDGARLSATAWLDELESWCRRYPFVSLEDPFHEDDWVAWQAASERLGRGRQVLGDDLFATNLSRLEKGVSLGAANAVLVKPNQAGTLSRAAAVLTAAQAAGYATVVSARSGDTEDHWLADLAVGWRAGQVKVGSTQRSERTAKWNRLLEIEADAGGKAQLWQP